VAFSKYYDDFVAKGGDQFTKNLQLRADMMDKAANDPYFQKGLIEAWRKDILFFFISGCWLYEPRKRFVNGKRLPNIIPFIPWKNQVPNIKKARDVMQSEEGGDLGIEKSRGEGASWIFCLMATHDWLFDDMSSIGIMSRNEAAVDATDDPDTLLWKVNWSIEQLPEWLVGTKTGPGDKPKDWTRSVSKHTITNHRNGSQIVGASATGDTFRGGRRTWIMFDELASFPRPLDHEVMASIEHVTDTKVLISTPKGAEGEYYQIMHRPSNMVKLIFDWKDNQTRNKGSYKLVHGKCVPLEGFTLKEEYDPPSEDIKDMWSRLRAKGFKLENKVRSPWYDKQCDKPGATPQSIAQELDRDYGGSVHRIMGDAFFKKARSTVMPHKAEGSMTYDRGTMEMSFQETKNGPIKLWCNLDHSGRPPIRPYAVAADVSSGLGGSHTSNSVIEVIDLISMEQVMEYTTNIVEPSVFGEHAVAISKWFHEAYLAWEINYGGGFGKRVKDLNYPNVFMRTAWTKKGRRKTKEIGWHTNPSSKSAGFADMIRMVEKGEIKIRSEALRQECSEYVMIEGKIEHLTAKKNPSDTTKGEAHGDRVMAFMVGVQAAIDRPTGASVTIGQTSVDQGHIPPWTMAARMAEWDKDKKTDDWDDVEVGRMSQ